MAGGLWIPPWDLAVAAVALGLLWVTAKGARRAGRTPRGSRESGPANGRRRFRRRGLAGGRGAA